MDSLKLAYEAGVKLAMQETGLLEKQAGLGDYMIDRAPGESSGHAMGQNLLANIPSAGVGAGVGLGAYKLLPEKFKLPGALAAGLLAGGGTNQALRKAMGRRGLLESLVPRERETTGEKIKSTLGME